MKKNIFNFDKIEIKMSIYKETIFPTEKNHTIELPKNMYGKEVEIIFNIKDVLPNSKKQDINLIFENFGKGADFSTTEEIRKQNWSRKW